MACLLQLCIHSASTPLINLTRTVLSSKSCNNSSKSFLYQISKALVLPRVLVFAEASWRIAGRNSPKIDSPSTYPAFSVVYTRACRSSTITAPRRRPSSRKLRKSEAVLRTDVVAPSSSFFPAAKQIGAYFNTNRKRIADISVSEPEWNYHNKGLVSIGTTGCARAQKANELSYQTRKIAYRFFASKGPRRLSDPSRAKRSNYTFPVARLAKARLKCYVKTTLGTFVKAFWDSGSTISVIRIGENYVNFLSKLINLRTLIVLRFIE